MKPSVPLFINGIPYYLNKPFAVVRKGTPAEFGTEAELKEYILKNNLDAHFKNYATYHQFNGKEWISFEQ